MTLVQIRSRLAKALRGLARRIDPDPSRSLYIGDELKIGQVTVAVGKAVDEKIICYAEFIEDAQRARSGQAENG